MGSSPSRTVKTPAMQQTENAVVYYVDCIFLECGLVPDCGSKGVKENRSAPGLPARIPQVGVHACISPRRAHLRSGSSWTAVPRAAGHQVSAARPRPRLFRGQTGHRQPGATQPTTNMLSSHVDHVLVDRLPSRNQTPHHQSPDELRVRRDGGGTEGRCRLHELPTPGRR